MEVFDIVTDILAMQKSNAEILEIYKTGSQVYYDNPRDMDYVVLCKDYSSLRQKFHPNIDGIQYDIIIMDILALHDQLDFNKNLIVHPDVKLHNYAILLKETIYGNYDHNWDIFQHEEEYMQFMKDRYANSLGRRVKKEKATKSWSHYYIVLKMFENRTTIISDQMKKDIALLHDSLPGTAGIIEWIERKLDILK